MGSTEQRPTPWPSLKCYWSAAPLDSASGNCVDAITYVPGVSRHRTIMNIFEKETRIHKDVFVAPSAAVIGDIQIGPGSSLWYGSILRGDVNNIHIESGTNMQDNSLVRVPRSNISGKVLPTIIGSNVTVSHSAVLHACTIEDEAFVGMGATLLDGVVVEKHSMVGAGSLVKQNTRIPAGEVRVGNPAKFRRRLTEEEIVFISQSTTNYINLAQLHEAENATSFECANYVTDLSVSVLSSQFKAVNLPEFNLEFNLFKGGIPESVTALPKLTVLGAPKAGLEGNVPSNWGRCHSLRMVNLAHNLLFGVIPRGLGQCSNLKFLNLSSNRLSGSLGNDLYPHLIVVFDVSGDELSGSIPAFANKGCSSQLMLDDMQSDYSLLVMFEAVAELSLGYCDSGERSVVCHNFAKYNFGGHLTSLPFSADRFGNKTLYAFLVDHNNFTGSLDAILLEQCGNLNGLIVSFRDNKISGGLTAEISTKCHAIRVLDLAGNQISGVMPANIGLLVALVNMDISRNLLEGQIPASFKNFKSLKFLSLAGNNLSGHIPSCLGQLRSLEVLDLSSNSLSGNIPGSLVTLKDLTALLLNNNKLSGNISNLTPSASLSIFNISFNNFSGPLPSNIHSLACNSTHENSSLQPCRLSTVSNPLMNVRVLTETDVNPTPDNTPTDGGGGFSKIEIASITSASAIVAVLLALIILYIYTRKCASRSSRRSLRRREVTVFVDIGAPLTYETVVRATGSFNASNCIGSGGFGATYKAEIAPGVLVAIKRLAIGRFQGIQQFQAEVKTLGRCRHANLVTLIGYHLGDSEMFLIYNFLPGGNLERFIQERTKRPIDWRMLHKIALDIARALAYLHDNCVPRILHRDVKPSNILLDNEYNAYLSDFGLARLLGNSETHATTGVAGTFGYVAPEYAMTCRVSDKADVYSYGVVLLELISDKKALDPSFSPYGNGFNIVAWACMLLQKGRAREFFIEGLWDAAPHDDLVEILHLGIKCTVDSLSSRPTMKQVVRRLKELRPPSY